MARSIGAIVCAAVTLATLPAVAQDLGDPCAAFAWPLPKERIILSRAVQVSVPAGGYIDYGPPTGFQMLLSPVDNVAFVERPDAPAMGGYGGVITLGRPPADGDYLVTLSDVASVAVIQSDGALAPIAESHAKDCPGMRESVKFHLSARAPLVVQISGAASNRINVAVTPANFLNY